MSKNTALAVSICFIWAFAAIVIARALNTTGDINALWALIAPMIVSIVAVLALDLL